MSSTLYFAYGSNLGLAQMAERCPSSEYVGRGVLPDYRWQINVRGFANVVPCCGYSVHGLVYRVGADDEARLDRNEGVGRGFYSKAYKDIILHPASPVPTSSLAGVNSGGSSDRHRRRASRIRGDAAGGARQPYLRSDVLVYISHSYVAWGSPRDEYIDRLNAGFRDAIALGVPAEFFDNATRTVIPDLPVPDRPVSAPGPLRRGRQTLSQRDPRRPRPASRPQPDRGGGGWDFLRLPILGFRSSAPREMRVAGRGRNETTYVYGR